MEPKIYSVDQLKMYILRKLGSPVINIEITDDQLVDAIDDTLDDYLPRAYSGVIERYIPVQLITDIQQYILPYSTFAVLGVYDGVGTMMGANQPANLFSINQFIAADLYKPGAAKIDVLGYELINQMISTLELVFAKKITYDFNSISKVLNLVSKPVADTKVIIHMYQKLDLEKTPIYNADPSAAPRYYEENIFNEKWIKRMATARAQLQWGQNLMKYTGSVLPNGGTLNAEFIYNEAKANVDALMIELHEEFELPTDFFIG